MSPDRRRQLIEPGHLALSVVRQCELVSISRSGFYYQPAGATTLTLALMRLIDEQFLETPWYGSRQMARHLRRHGHIVGRKRVRRLMGLMGLTPIYQHPRTTVPHPEHRIHPYLLRGLVINRPNQVWCADITPGSSPGAGSYSDATGLSLPRGGDGLVDAQGAGMASVQHHGRDVLHRSSGGSPGVL
jgi:putative transposase